MPTTPPGPDTPPCADELRRDNRRLRQQAERLRVILDTVDDAVFVHDETTGRILDVNRGACVMYGWNAAEMETLTVGDLSADEPPYTTADAVKLIRQAAAGQPQRFEWHARHRDGHRFWVEVHLTRTRSPAQGLLIAVVRDITARKEADEALRKEEDRFRLRVETMSDGIAVRDPDGRLTYVNDRFCEMLGYGCDEIVGQNVEVFLDAENRRVYRHHVDPVRMETRQTYELTWTTKDGGPLHTLMSPRSLLGPRGEYRGSFAVVTDISERLRAERILLESERKYRTLVETTGTGYLIVDGEGRVLEANDEYVRLTGHRTFAEIKGRRVTEWTAPYDLERNAAEVAKCVREGYVRDLRIDYQGPGGEITPIEINATTVYQGGQLRIIALNRDVTSRIRAETARIELERQLRQSRLLEALGRLSGGVAHDFNNILGSILGCVYTAGLAAGSDAQRDLQSIRVLCKRGGEITRQLLTVAQRETGRVEAVEIASQLEEIRVLLEHSLPRTVRLEVSTAPDAGWVRADRALLASALLNLCLNARDAMPGGGSLTVAARRVGDPDWVEIAVRDSGQGMTREVQERIFEPFFTTKQTGRSRGLGLSTVRASVEAWGGQIRVESTPGEGSTFVLRLRAAPGRAAIPPLSETALTHPLTPSPVLVVEDEELIGTYLEESLGAAGYATTRARTGLEGLELLRKTPHGFGLLILDLILPGLGGAEICRLVNDLAPYLPVLVVTGREDMAAELGPDTQVVAKPFTPEELLAGVARALGPSGTR